MPKAKSVRKPRKLRSPLKKDEVYCVSCKHRRKAAEMRVQKVRNPKRGMVPIAKAICPVCDAKMCKIVG